MFSNRWTADGERQTERQWTTWDWDLRVKAANKNCFYLFMRTIKF